MFRRNSIMVILAVFLLTTILTACQPKLSEEEVQSTLQSSIAQTLTAAPTFTPLPTATPSPTPTATATPKVVAYGPTNFPDNVNPLTGLEVADPNILNRRPVMVKVANWPIEGRPHAGLSSADIVFDYYTGEGMNRFVALLYGQDAPQVGPIRSGRLIDPQLVLMYGGILAMMSAWDWEYDEIISTLGGRVVSGDHCNDTYQAICRIDTDAPYETTAFADTAQMSAYYGSKSYATNTKPVLDGMSFATIPPAGGVDASEFTMHYGKNNNALWKYDEATGKYFRWIDDINYTTGEATMIPLVDRNNGDQLQFSNVIVVFSEIKNVGSGDTIHRYGLIGSVQRAMLFRNGKMYDIYYKAYYDKPITFIDAEGNPVPLQPGNTWIHFTGLQSRVEQDPLNDSIWKVSLRTP